MITTKPTAYISGGMTGLPEFNYPAFFAAELALTALGFGVINPARNHPLNRTWLGYMVISRAQVKQSHVIACLPGWIDSVGACEEVDLAATCGIPVTTVEHLIEEPNEWKNYILETC